jgi:hypothetical protein
VTRETLSKAGVRIGLDRKVIPAESSLQPPEFPQVLTWFQMVGGRFVVVGVQNAEVMDFLTAIVDLQRDTVSIQVVKTSNIKLGLAAAETSEWLYAPEAEGPGVWTF